MNYTAIVPARSGSKRLPNKNILPLAGKPLVVWTVEACVGAEKIGTVIVSTDSMDYWELVRSHVRSDKLALDYRTPEEAGDRVKIFDYLRNGHAKIFGDRTGAFILTLPTVPLRRSHHISQAIDLCETRGGPVFSATAYGFPITFAFRTTDDGGWSPVFPDGAMVTGNTRSQDQAAAYHPNGAIYVRAIADLARPDLVSLYQGATPYLMDRADSVDIDSEVDFALAEAILKLGRT